MSVYIDERWQRLARALSLARAHIRRRSLHCKNFTIISNNCIGGVICEALNREFTSPTINLYIRPKDFVRFCGDRRYLSLPLQELPFRPEIGYPVATIAGEITLYCKHYRTFEEVQEAWTRRTARIDWDHLCLMMTDRDFTPPFSLKDAAGFCGEDVLRDFDALPCPHKVCFVKEAEFAQKYNSCVRVTKCCDRRSVGVITEFATVTGKHLYECAADWDYISFLNQVDGAPQHPDTEGS